MSEIDGKVINTNRKCDCCGHSFNKGFQFGEKIEYESGWSDVCLNCINISVKQLSESTQ